MKKYTVLALLLLVPSTGLMATRIRDGLREIVELDVVDGSVDVVKGAWDDVTYPVRGSQECCDDYQEEETKEERKQRMEQEKQDRAKKQQRKESKRRGKYNRN